MRKIFAAAVIAAFAATSACGHSHAQEDGGATVSRNYQVGPFSQVEVAGPYDVEVRTGSAPTIAAQGPEKMLQHTIVEVKGDKLYIRSEEHRGLGRASMFRGKAKFVVTVPELRSATIAGSGGIKVDKISGDAFEGTIAGSGGLTLASADVQSLKLSIAGSGGIKTGSGKAANADYGIAGSGGIEASGIDAQHAKVTIAGSGSVQGTARDTAEVEIMGSGDVNLTGGAKCSVNKMGSGNVHCS